MSGAEALSQDAFDRLLSHLHPDRDEAGSRYEGLRSRLVRFFDARGFASPEDHADETLNRLARKIGAGETVRDLPSYAVGVARMVALEQQKRFSQMQKALHQPPAVLVPPHDEHHAVRLDCVHACLARLETPERRLILDYYHGERRGRIDARRDLAAALDLPLNALRIRAYRLRQRLEACVRACVTARSRNGPAGSVRTG